MRPPAGLLSRQVTPQPTNGSDRGDPGPLRNTGEAVWNQFVDLLRWLGDISLSLLWAGLIVVAIVWVTGRLRRRLRAILEARIRGRNNLPALLDNILQIAIYIFAALFAFSALGADSAAFVQAFGLITAAVSLSLQDVLKNFVAGIYLLVEEPFSPGDRLEVAGQVGTVEQINIRTTVLRNDKAQQVLVPNYNVFSQVVTNRTAYQQQSLTIQITGIKDQISGIKDDAGKEIGGVEHSLADVPGLTTTPPKIELTKVGPDDCELTVTVWIPPGGDPRREVVQRLRARFPEATLTISS